jgi:hypothetical protein
MVGLVCGRLEEAQNVGYVLPNEEIEAFLQRGKGGRYRGKPLESSSTEYQPLENEAPPRPFVRSWRATREGCPAPGATGPPPGLLLLLCRPTQQGGHLGPELGPGLALGLGQVGQGVLVAQAGEGGVLLPVP